MNLVRPRALGFAVLALAALGCESIAGVDVTYRGDDASTAADVGTSVDGGSEAQAEIDAPFDHAGLVVDDAPFTFDAYATVQNGKCSCDTTAGEGCCIPPSNGAPFCTTSASNCPGVYLACYGVDPGGDSACCWNGAGDGAYTGFSATCGTRPTMCQGNADCGGTGCATVSCGGVTLGVCGATAPSCP